ncbi:MAG: DUF4430 domain-containing protein [Clostridiales bacterium]|nr:DUF4430 domain-containing protein [Clostridiales bacterium]
MKLTRIISLMIVGVLLALSFVSCQGSVEKQEVTVTVRIIADDPDEPVLDTQITFKAETPTVLGAVIEACNKNEISYVLTDGEDSIKDIQEYVNYTDADGIMHYWMYYINDVEPTSGKANTNAVADGDVILYQYIAFDPAAAK